MKRFKIREIIRKVINSRNELDTWIRAESPIDIYKRIIDLDGFKAENLGYMDLIGILYLMVKLQGLRFKEEVKHIVIDEAQDYSFIQFEIIKEMTGCNSYTIVGDSNQRLITTDEEPAMLHLDEVFKNSNAEIKSYELNKSYRSTQEIMEYANQFINEERIVPLVRNGEPIIEEEVSSKDDFINTVLSIIQDYEEDGHENIAVIFKDKKELAKFAPLLKEKISIQSLDNEDILYKGGKVLLPAYLAKGLEFDGVIVIENKEIQPLLKYIMCTRALHRLSVIKDLI
jgi:DNA helicase-2/ATP-dependent DNA helicase PcrA